MWGHEHALLAISCIHVLWFIFLPLFLCYSWPYINKVGFLFNFFFPWIWVRLALEKWTLCPKERVTIIQYVTEKFTPKCFPCVVYIKWDTCECAIIFSWRSVHVAWFMFKYWWYNSNLSFEHIEGHKLKMTQILVLELFIYLFIFFLFHCMPRKHDSGKVQNL